MFSFGNKGKVDIEEVYNGSHGDHWNSVFGFDNQGYVESQVENIFNELKDGTKIKRNIFKHRATYGLLSAIGIQSKETLITLYPSLFASKTIPVSIKSIKEWGHSDKLEAQVLGAGRNTFGLDFFAIDYAENSKKYKRGGELNIALAGFAYVIDKETKDENLEVEFSDDFCSYLPNSDLSTGYDFDFIGEVLSIKPAKLSGEELFIIEVKLINDENNPNFFVLPIVANPKNMKISNISPGSRITGCFWLQGRIS